MGLLIGVIAGTDQGTHGRVLKTQLPGFPLKPLERFGMDVASHRQMMAGWGEILANREHVDGMSAHVAHHRQDFVVGLAQTHHQTALGGDAGMALFEGLQEGE